MYASICASEANEIGLTPNEGFTASKGLFRLLFSQGRCTCTACNRIFQKILYSGHSNNHCGPHLFYFFGKRIL